MNSDPLRKGDASGMLFDHYQVEKTLGTGAMGVVYLARDLRIGRKVALKTIPRGPRHFESAEAEQEFFDRFRREAELCGSLIHTNIITLYEVGWEERRISYLAMEYIEGESLMSLMNREQTLSLEASLKIVDDMLQGLAYAHARNVVHRDIKPANVLISVTGDAKLADFGVARYARSVGKTTLTDVGQIIGTPYYMSPEVIAGKPVDGQADLFSVGVVLYEMLSGQKPFAGTDLMDVLYNIVNAPAPDVQFVRPDLPRWVGALIRRLLSKNPADRYLSAAAASRELRRLVGDQSDTNPLLKFGRRIPVVSNLTPEETPTTPILLDSAARRSLRRLNRTIPTMIGVGVIAALSVPLLLAVGFMQREVRNDQAAVVAAPSPDEVRAKEAALREARLLYEAGMFEESLRHYRAYLERYPWSEVALAGEREAFAAVEKIEADQAHDLAEKERRWEEIQRRRGAQRSSGPNAGGSSVPPVSSPPATVSAEPDLAETSPPKKPFWSRIFRRPPPAEGQGQ
ncbi:MAG TPA: serine/threonine-protein kinase [Thermoanaerobaculia bacterium]|nr:serine/threonine-protein kinase [Thermoanaerobaculia bacterium]